MYEFYLWILLLSFSSAHQEKDTNCLRINPGLLGGEFNFLDKHTLDKDATHTDFTNSLTLFSTRFKTVHKLLTTPLETLRNFEFEESQNQYANTSTNTVPFFVNVYSGNKSNSIKEIIDIYRNISYTINKLNYGRRSPIIYGIYLQLFERHINWLLKVVDIVFGPKELATFQLGVILEECRWDLKTINHTEYFRRLHFITCQITPQKELKPEESAAAVIKRCDEIRSNATSLNITAEILCAISYSSIGRDFYGTTLSSIKRFQIFWCTIVNELTRNKSHAGIIMSAAIDLTPATIGEDDGAKHNEKYHTGWWKRISSNEKDKFVEKVEELPGGREFEKSKWNGNLLPTTISSTLPSENFNFLTIILSSVFAFSSVIVTFIIGFVIYRKRIANKALSRKELDHFFQGSIKSSKKSNQCDIELHQIVDEIPYDETLEVSKSEIGIYSDKVLGSGSFGVVVKGRVRPEEVAVKTTFPGVDKMFLKALMLELKILSYLGQHENIVNLRGAHTPQLTAGKLYLFLELCQFGNLLKFLRSHRGDFSHESSTEEISKVSSKRRLACKDLLQWAVQVSSAMVYLSEKKVVHGDIAARNVLVFSWEQVKLTDFGLSRRLYEYTNYVKKKQDPLPWRHMSVEALKDLTFSEKSDVWAFGVLLWEIFSLGEVPFPGLSWSLDFLQRLLSGLRPLQPQHAHPLVYEVMTSCWINDAKLRPSSAVVHSGLISVVDNLLTNPLYICP